MTLCVDNAFIQFEFSRCSSEIAVHKIKNQMVVLRAIANWKTIQRPMVHTKPKQKRSFSCGRKTVNSAEFRVMMWVVSGWGWVSGHYVVRVVPSDVSNLQSLSDSSRKVGLVLKSCCG